MKFAHAAPVLFGFAVLPPTAASATAPDGAALFRQRCASCHSVEHGDEDGIAPNLAGIVGRKAAGIAYDYSPALRASGLTWTRANLDAYLAAPMRKVPGTRMALPVIDPQQRSAILDFLARPRR